MAQGALFIGWGEAARGREQQALQLFGEVTQYYTQLQQRGEIASFEPVLLEPHGGDLAGFLLVKGEEDALGRLRASEEFQRFNARAQLCLERVGVVGAAVGEGLQRQFALFQQLVAEVG